MMSELTLAAFKTFQLADKSLLNPLLDNYQTKLGDYTFATMYIWGDIFQLVWKIYKGKVIIYGGKDDFIQMPAGKQNSSVDELIKISDAFIAQGKSGNFVLVEGTFIKDNPELKKLKESFSIEKDEINSDYVYLTKKLVELKGKKLQKKKNLLAQFQRINPAYQVQNLKIDYFNDCLALADKCYRLKSCDTYGFKAEKVALKKAFADFEILQLKGIVILVKDEIVGFSIFGKQNKNTAVEYFEKYDPTIKGAAQVINWETAKFLQNNYQFLNREEDMGIAGLRRAKKSYNPEYIVDTYRFIRRPSLI